MAPRTVPAGPITERQFQQQVVHLAHLHRWRVMHVRPTIGRRNGQAAWQTATSTPGWPDLTIWRPGRLLLVELKTDRGRLSPAQREVIGSLRDAGVDVRVWRPADWPEIETTLKGGA